MVIVKVKILFIFIFVSQILFAGNSCIGAMFKESAAVRSYLKIETLVDSSATERSKFLGSFSTVEPSYMNTLSCLEDQLLIIANYSTLYEDQNGVFGYLAIVSPATNKYSQSGFELVEYCNLILMRPWTEDEAKIIKNLKEDFGSMYRTPDYIRKSIRPHLLDNLKLNCKSDDLIS